MLFGARRLCSSAQAGAKIPPMITGPFVRAFVGVSLLFASVAASAQDHACESDSVVVIGGEKAYRKECCGQRPYTALVATAREQGIAIKARRTAQEPKPGYFLCVVEFAWEPRWE